MVLRRFYGKQRDERLWERNLYICKEANRQVPPIVVRGISDGMYVGWHLHRAIELTVQFHYCNSVVMYLLCLLC